MRKNKMTEKELEQLREKYRLTKGKVFNLLLQDIQEEISDNIQTINNNLPSVKKGVNLIAGEDLVLKGRNQGLMFLSELDDFYKRLIDEEEELRRKQTK